MIFQILCECGRTSTVRGSQAGTTVECECGRNGLIPPLRQLQRSAETGERAPMGVCGAVADQAVQTPSPPREFVMLLAREEDLRSRIHAEAFHSFLAVCQQSVDDVFSDLDDAQGCDVQVACALLPNGEKIIEFEAHPKPISRTMESLGEAIRDLQCPPIAHGPVPFAFPPPCDRSCAE